MKRVLWVGAGLAAWLEATPCAASASGDELVRQAREHEAAGDADLAIRRYMEALDVDPTNGGAWLGLGALRLRLGESAEAERVYAAALDRVPALIEALQGRAHARWKLGSHAAAEDDLERYATATASVSALRELAEWYAADGRAPAQLAVWRRLLARAAGQGDAAAAVEARRMVRALVWMVDGADPACSPEGPDATRRALASIARRGG